MAKIDEERLLVRFSTLIRDTDSTANITLINSNLISNVEAVAQAVVEAALLEANLDIQVIVEANVFVGNI